MIAERDATKLLSAELLDAREKASESAKSREAVELLKAHARDGKTKDELVETLFERIDELTDRLEETERGDRTRTAASTTNRAEETREELNAVREEMEQQKRLANRYAAERDHLMRANEQLTMTLESREAFDAHGDVEGYEIALKTSREENKSLREDVDRLKATIDGLDAQRLDLGEKFKRSHETLKEAETRAKKAEEELQMIAEAQQNGQTTPRTSFLSSELLRKNGKNTDADHLAKALEIERDRLQQECDALTETLAESEARLQAVVNECQMAKSSEAKAVRERSAVEKLRQQEIDKAHQLDRSLADALEDAKSAREETKQHREELRFVAEDLVAMTREQQSVNDDYLRACAERDRAWKDLRHAERALENVEVNSVSTAKELEDVARAYRELEGEHKLAVRELSATSSDNQKLEKALQQTEDGLRAAKERSRVLDSENRALSSEARNLERRVSQLTKELEEMSSSTASTQTRKGGKSGEDFAPNGLGSLSEQLEEVTKTCEDLKRQNERYRKQHAEVESEFRTLRNKLEESSQERDRLKLRTKLESNRAEELEGLLASTRAREYDFSMTNEDDSKRLKLLKERVDALSEDNERLTSRLEAANATNAQLSNELENIKPNSSVNPKNTKDSESQTLNAARNLAKSLAHSESVVVEQQRRMREIMEETKDLRERVEEAENRAASAASFAKQAENKSKRSAARESELRVQLQGAFEDLRLAREASKRFADENSGFAANGEEFETLKRSLEEALEEKEKLEIALSAHVRRSNDLGVMHDANSKQMSDLRTHVDRLDALLRERDRELLEARARQSELLEEFNQSKLFSNKSSSPFQDFGSSDDLVNQGIDDDTKRAAFEALARSVREPVDQSPLGVRDFVQAKLNMDNDDSNTATNINKNDEDLEHLEELRLENELLRQENDKLSRELDGTEEATEEMHAQLQKISDDYNALAKTLNETLNVVP